ncbi:TetR/AcrR family transcriptional regulator [Amycolatopsis orientalis]|uniref:TetR/AcrR family transcriptional regulator n=1 Tax=Amycolatopsis orientalis TaxID=31958 RepID=UPI000562934A|nr:TetR/AcrR family transcriptional regulator [Amycolatopsis orientalis]
MSVNETEREQAILDAAAGLLLRFGYAKLTMGDVAGAVDLHRGLVYLCFKSKDDLVDAVVARELDRYATAWRERLEADPEGGSVGSMARAMLGALKTLPLAAAIVARDEEVFGKYLRKPGSHFQRQPPAARTREFLDAMRDAGVLRPEVDTRAMAFLTDALTPAVRRAFLRGGDAPADPEQPSWEQVLETLVDLLDRTLTPPGADLAAGKAILVEGLDKARAGFAPRNHRTNEHGGADEND